MTSTNMKTNEEKFQSMEAWVTELFSLPGHDALDYANGVSTLLSIFIAHKHPKYQGHVFSIKATTSVVGGEVFAEASLPRYAFGGCLPDAVAHTQAYLGKNAQEVKDIRSNVCACVLFKYITAAFDNDITPKMFSLFCEHVASDVEGYLSRDDLQGFSACIADYWNLAGFVSGHSHGIHDATTRGYGAIDNNGFWLFPLPDCQDHIVVTPPEPKEAGHDVQF